MKLIYKECKMTNEIFIAILLIVLAIFGIRYTAKHPELLDDSYEVKKQEDYDEASRNLDTYGTTLGDSFESKDMVASSMYD